MTGALRDAVLRDALVSMVECEHLHVPRVDFTAWIEQVTGDRQWLPVAELSLTSPRCRGEVYDLRRFGFGYVNLVDSVTIDSVLVYGPHQSFAEALDEMCGDIAELWEEDGSPPETITP